MQHRLMETNRIHPLDQNAGLRRNIKSLFGRVALSVARQIGRKDMELSREQLGSRHKIRTRNSEAMNKHDCTCTFRQLRVRSSAIDSQALNIGPQTYKPPALTAAQLCASPAYWCRDSPSDRSPKRKRAERECESCPRDMATAEHDGPPDRCWISHPDLLAASDSRAG
jgi:hypothetical protein